MIRLYTSRPRLSVPSQYVPPGGWKTANEFWAMGSYGATKSANTASSRTTSSTSAATAPSGFRLEKRATAFAHPTHDSTRVLGLSAARTTHSYLTRGFSQP